LRSATMQIDFGFLFEALLLGDFVMDVEFQDRLTL